MASGVETHLQLLSVFKNSNSKVRKAILKNCDNKFIDLIAEICYNYLRGNIKCSRKQFCELKKHKKCLHRIVELNIKNSRNVNKRKRVKPNKSERDILLQKGDGFWLALLPIAAELGAHYITKALRK